MVLLAGLPISKYCAGSSQSFRQSFNLILLSQTRQRRLCLLAFTVALEAGSQRECDLVIYGNKIDYRQTTVITKLSL